MCLRTGFLFVLFSLLPSDVLYLTTSSHFHFSVMESRFRAIVVTGNFARISLNADKDLFVVLHVGQFSAVRYVSSKTISFVCLWLLCCYGNEI